MHTTEAQRRFAITFWKRKRLSKGLNFKIKWTKTSKWTYRSTFKGNVAKVSTLALNRPPSRGISLRTDRRLNKVPRPQTDKNIPTWKIHHEKIARIKQAPQGQPQFTNKVPARSKNADVSDILNINRTFKHFSVWRNEYESFCLNFQSVTLSRTPKEREKINFCCKGTLSIARFGHSLGS